MNDKPPAATVLPDWLTRDESGRLLADGMSLDALAQQFGTPLYLYSRAQIEATFEQFRLAVKGRKATICYALKANSNLAIIDLMGRLGCGFDIVSGGELERVIAAGGTPSRRPGPPRDRSSLRRRGASTKRAPAERRREADRRS